MATVSNIDEDFLLSGGGLLNKAMVKMRMRDQELAIAAFCVTWLPLFIFSAIEGTLYGGIQLPFLKDVAMQARLLIALQMLILIKGSIDMRVTTVLKYFTETLIKEEDRRTVVPTIIRRGKKLTDSAITEILLLLLVIVVTTSFVRAGIYSSLEHGTSSWMTTVSEGNKVLSKAGYWAVLVSIPVFQFLLFRWLWRYFVWILLLYRLSRTHLNLLPTHADRAGGLGIIMLAQRAFNKLFVVGSVVLSGQFIGLLTSHPEQFIMIRNEAIGYIIIAILFTLLPFVFFSRKLLRAKNAGLQKLSSLGFVLSSKFEREWAGDLAIEKRIENNEDNKVDPSILFDYSGLYNEVKKIRSFPVTIGDITGLGISLFIPFIPILFIRFSFGELLQRILGMLV